MKKLTALLLIVVMVLSMGTGFAFAANKADITQVSYSALETDDYEFSIPSNMNIGTSFTKEFVQDGTKTTVTVTKVKNSGLKLMAKSSSDTYHVCAEARNAFGIVLRGIYYDVTVSNNKITSMSNIKYKRGIFADSFYNVTYPTWCTAEFHWSTLGIVWIRAYLITETTGSNNQIKVRANLS